MTFFRTMQEPYPLKQYELVELSYSIYVSRLTVVAIVACLIYDYLLTFSDEMNVIWPTRLTIAKIAFFFNRYLPFIANIGMMYTLVIGSGYNNTCNLQFLLFSSLIISEIFIAAFIVYVRAYAVWGCRRPIFYLLAAAYVAFSAVAVFFSVHFVRTSTVYHQRIFLSGCLLGLHSCYACIFSMIVIVISEAFALSMILIRKAQLDRSTLMRRIAEDGIWYFFVVISASVANIFALSVTNPGLCDFLLALQSTLQSICCTRLLLRTRQRPENRDIPNSLTLTWACPSDSQVPSRVQSSADNDIELNLMKYSQPISANTSGVKF